MNWKDQFAEAATYGLTSAVMNFGLDGVNDIIDPDAVKGLLENVPESSRAFLGVVYELIHETGLDSYAGMFLINLGTSFTAEYFKNGSLTKEQRMQIIKSSLINTLAFTLADRLIEDGANMRVVEEKQKIEDLLNSSPKATQDLMRHIKHSELNDLIEPTRDVLNRYKNKNDLRALTDTIKDLGEQLENCIMDAKKAKENARLREIEKQKIEIQELQIKPKLLEIIQREKEGKYAKVPNAVLFTSKKPKSQKIW